LAIFTASPNGRLKIVGAAIFLIGLAVAAGIWIAQDRIDRQESRQGDDPDQVATLDSRKDVRQLELYYGKSGLIAEGWTEWLQSLAHGKRLAATIAIVSAILGGGCFLAAARFFPGE
jgi:hypothetical protein